MLATDIPENKTRWQTEHFRCEFCPAKVYPRFTPRTETSSGRRPHFARNPSSDANPNYHASDCIYNVERIVDELIETSEEQLERSKSGRPKYRLPWPQTFQRQDPRSPLDPPEQDVELHVVDIDPDLRAEIVATQELQKMVNVSLPSVADDSTRED